METADVVIIGAGIIGLSAAFQLARRCSLRIVVLEKGRSLGEGSTGASSAVCRFRYSHGEMVELARDGIGAYQRWGEFLERRGPVGRFHCTGVVWIDNELQGNEADEVARLRAHGVATSCLTFEEIHERFPALSGCILPPDMVIGNPHDCATGRNYLFEDDGGYVEPTDALQDLLEAVRSRAIEVRFNARVQAIARSDSRVRSVMLGDGSEISCGSVIIASGPWCNELLGGLGLADRWPLVPTRIQIAQVDLPSNVPGPVPVCGDITAGIYFRPQGRRKHLIIGSVLPEDEREAVDDPDHFDRSADDHFIRTKLHGLQHRIPALTDLKGVTGYSGLYTMNLADVHPVVGKTPIEGLYVANGCSGHGFKLAPAIGSLIAQSIAGGRLPFDTAVDPDFLSFERKPIAMRTQSVLA